MNNNNNEIKFETRKNLNIHMVHIVTIVGNMYVLQMLIIIKYLYSKSAMSADDENPAPRVYLK